VTQIDNLISNVTLEEKAAVCTGAAPGKEIVQVYVHDRKSSLVCPPKELKGFARVKLQPGETKTVDVMLDFRTFAFYHPGYRRWITNNGEFDILIGCSSADIRCTETITRQSTLELPSLLNRNSTLREWQDDPTGLQVLSPHIDQVKQQLYATFDLDISDNVGMDPINYIMDSSLLGVLSSLGDSLPESPEAMGEGFLLQVHQSQ
jgi:beta-glucosidase